MDPCPYLPAPERTYTADDVHALGRDRSERFYLTALHYAQTLWLQGFPAKALLQVNRALSCWLPDLALHPAASPTDLSAPTLAPYHAKAWMMRHRPEGRFIGNPRRHYQHLASRMVEPHKELRTWRAWA
ncbi:MAG: hypothetical protein ACOYMN_11645, partial [Roseimicrobium sp.]